MKYIIVVLFLISGAKLFSQDQLFKKDNSKQDVKVLEVTPDEVKYKLKSNPEGPLYIIKKSDVALIIYENGSHETYPDAKPLPQIVTIVSPYNIIDSIRVQRKRESLKKFSFLTKNKNVTFVNILGLANSCLSLSYLREFGQGYFSVHVPVSFSFAKPLGGQYLSMDGAGGYYYENVSNYKLVHKAIETGLGLYFHTSGKRPVTHFVGPYVSFAQYNGTFQSRNFYVDPNSYNYVNYDPELIEHGFVLNELSFMVNNGLLIRITPELNLMIHAAIGFTTSRDYIANDPSDFVYSAYGTYRQNNIQAFNIGFNFGYRF
ncbi:MAG: hypothetical protein IPJ32_03295 [Sphingobacteriaceae bacterium]|nr:hypothetical protein [Sphingobacteriaceae bacterium]